MSVYLEYEWEKYIYPTPQSHAKCFCFHEFTHSFNKYTVLVTLYLVTILATEGPEVNKLLKILAFMDFALNSNNLLKFKT